MCLFREKKGASVRNIKCTAKEGCEARSTSDRRPMRRSMENDRTRAQSVKTNRIAGRWKSLKGNCREGREREVHSLRKALSGETNFTACRFATFLGKHMFPLSFFLNVWYNVRRKPCSAILRALPSALCAAAIDGWRKMSLKVHMLVCGIISNGSLASVGLKMPFFCFSCSNDIERTAQKRLCKHGIVASFMREVLPPRFLSVSAAQRL